MSIPFRPNLPISDTTSLRTQSTAAYATLQTGRQNGVFGLGAQPVDHFSAGVNNRNIPQAVGPQADAKSAGQKLMGLVQGLVGVLTSLIGMLSLLRNTKQPATSRNAASNGDAASLNAKADKAEASLKKTSASVSSTEKSKESSKSSSSSPSKPPLSPPPPMKKKTAPRARKGPTKKAPRQPPKRGVKPDSKSPLALDINGPKGVQTSDKKVRFDIDGDGRLDQVNDVREGVLAFGKGRTGKELFGDNTDLNGDGKADGYKNGFEALRALAKKEGMYDEAKGDTRLDSNEIQALEQKYNFGLKQGYNAEMESLTANGVTEIELGSENAKTSFHQGEQSDVTLQKQDGATFKHNGETKEYVDVWHRV